MGIGIKCVVDRIAVSSAQGTIVLHNGFATTVREDKVILRDQRTKWIVDVLLDARQRGRCVHIPKGDPGVALAATRKHSSSSNGSNAPTPLCLITRSVWEAMVINSGISAAVLYISSFTITQVASITMALAIVNIGLGKGEAIRN